MVYTYGMKNSPTVGKGLGGLPRRSDILTYPFDVPMNGAPVLNTWRSSILSGSPSNQDMGFHVKDRRRVFVQVFMLGDITSDSGLESIVVGHTGGSAEGTSRFGNAANIGISWAFADASNLMSSITLTAGFNVQFLVIEFDVDVIFDELQTGIAGQSNHALSNTITDPDKTIVCGAGAYVFNSSASKVPKLDGTESAACLGTTNRSAIPQFPDANTLYLDAPTTGVFDVLIRGFNW